MNEITCPIYLAHVVPFKEKSLQSRDLQAFIFIEVTPEGFKPPTFRTGI